MSELKAQEMLVEHIGVPETERTSETSAIVTNGDPHDPLTWPLARKLAVMFVVGLWIFAGTFNMIIVGPALQIIPVELHSSFASSTYLIGGPLLAYGVASFLWVPMANRFGVRIIFISTAVGAGCMSVWGAKATTFGNLVAARTLASAFFASPETLAPQMVGNVFYLKDRAKAMTWITILQASGYAAGPLIGSFIIQNIHLGWRWTQWIIAIMTFGIMALLVTLVPETQYTRCPNLEKPTRSRTDDFRLWAVSGGGRPKVHSLGAGFNAIFPYFGHPIVLLSMLFFSVCLMVANYLLTTQSYTYLLVYHFSLGNAGLTFLAPLLGTWIAIFVCGILADQMFIRASHRSGTKPTPEHRLPLLAATGTVGIAGVILFGACTQEKCHWIGPVIGSFCLFFSFISSASVILAYLLDVYEARMDTVMVVFNGVKNIAAFAISYAIVPWNTSAGFTIPFVVLGMLLLVAHLLAALIWWNGEAMRRWTTERFSTGQETYHGEAF